MNMSISNVLFHAWQDEFWRRILLLNIRNFGYESPAIDDKTTPAVKPRVED